MRSSHRALSNVRGYASAVANITVAHRSIRRQPFATNPRPALSHCSRWNRRNGTGCARFISPRASGFCVSRSKSISPRGRGSSVRSLARSLAQVLPASPTFAFTRPAVSAFGSRSELIRAYSIHFPLARLFRQPASEWSGPRRRSSPRPRVPVCESHLGPETRDSYRGRRAIDSRWHNRRNPVLCFVWVSLFCPTCAKSDIVLAENCESFESNVLMW